MTEAEWVACTHTESMLEFLRSKASTRKLRLFVVACRRRLFALDGKGFSFKETPEAQENLADAPTVSDVANPTDDLTGHANQYAQGFAWAAHFAPNSCSEQLFAPVGRSYEVEQAAQCVLLRDIFRNPPRPSSPIPPPVLAWNDGTILRIAEGIYQERRMPEGTLDTARLAILANALLDAGCDNEDILAHCRSEGPHVRGCWVIDLILGKQ
jgi:hypothetical protein